MHRRASEASNVRYLSARPVGLGGYADKDERETGGEKLEQKKTKWIESQEGRQEEIERSTNIEWQEGLFVEKAQLTSCSHCPKAFQYFYILASRHSVLAKCLCRQT
ncbi:phytanoyl-coa dioxygenase [Plakobranchus ocellatus]|uniref:Phytanoyl-coa dioxygenase n=1 Tax=Plakobranchus ocellatus TaxID=259542 RepID=A0AAV4CNK7_9GAST|nr:phytanoyl-coa dioxygenase [Plakobranchus ocellatus]